MGFVYKRRDRCIIDHHVYGRLAKLSVDLLKELVKHLTAHAVLVFLFAKKTDFYEQQ